MLSDSYPMLLSIGVFIAVTFLFYVGSLLVDELHARGVKRALAFHRAEEATIAASERTRLLKQKTEVPLCATEAAVFPREIDVVISGGAFWATYAGIVIYVLRRHGVAVRRIAGTSGGCFVGLVALGQGPTDALGDRLQRAFCWAAAATTTLQRFCPLTLHALEDLWLDFFPAQAEPPPPPGTFVVGVSALRWRCGGLLPWPSLRTQDEFDSAAEVVDALAATARIPGIFGSAGKMRRAADVRKHGLALDGGVVALCPLFHDGARPQLVFFWDNLALRYGTLSGFGVTSGVLYEMAYLAIDAAAALLRGETCTMAAVLLQPGEELPTHVSRDLMQFVWSTAWRAFRELPGRLFGSRSRATSGRDKVE